LSFNPDFFGGLISRNQSLEIQEHEFFVVCRFRDL